MASLFPIQAGAVVPYRHIVTPIEQPERVEFRQGAAPGGDAQQSRTSGDKSNETIGVRARHTAATAAAGFAAHVLLEAGEIGADPADLTRRRYAYQSTPLPTPRVMSRRI